MRKKFALLMLCVLTGFVFSACDDDDDDIRNGRQHFVGREYVYTWAPQNTGNAFQLSLRFVSDSTFMLSCSDVQTGTLTSDPRTGSYTYDNDDDVYFYIGDFSTGLSTQSMKLIKGEFEDGFKRLEVDRMLNLGNGMTRMDEILFTRK